MYGKRSSDGITSSVWLVRGCLGQSSRLSLWQSVIHWRRGYQIQQDAKFMQSSSDQIRYSTAPIAKAHWWVLANFLYFIYCVVKLSFRSLFPNPHTHAPFHIKFVDRSPFPISGFPKHVSANVSRIYRRGDSTGSSKAGVLWAVATGARVSSSTWCYEED